MSRSAIGWSQNATGQSTFAPDAFTMRAYLAASVATKRANRADVAAGASLVLDDNTWPPALGEMLRDHAAGQGRRAA